MYRLGKVNVASNKNRNPTNVRNQCRGEPYVRPLTETEIKPMSYGEVKPWTHIHCFLDIGSFLVLVRRANTRFAPTLVSDIG
jgi:hypothetical protein